MRVNEPWHDDATRGIQGGFIRVCGAQIGAWSQRGDRPVPGQQRAVLNKAEPSKVRTALRSAGQGEQLVCRMDQHNLWSQ
jgi:hypothetical protein